MQKPLRNDSGTLRPGEASATSRPMRGMSMSSGSGFSGQSPPSAILGTDCQEAMLDIGPTPPTLGSAALASIRSSQPTVTMVSLLSSTTQGALARRMPWLAAKV
jgi:hypothetical protein